MLSAIAADIVSQYNHTDYVGFSTAYGKKTVCDFEWQDYGIS